MKATGLALNFRHFYYFWVVAKEGSITRAAERLDVAAQTISAQLSLLEQSLGKALFVPQGRRLAITEAGRMALKYADQIFPLSEQMMDAFAESETEGMMRLTVGIADSVPKSISSRFLEAAILMPQRVKPICYEYGLDILLADLALNKLDIVLSDRPASANSSVRLFSHLLGESEVTLYGAPTLAARYKPGFPKSLNGAPLLLPTRNNMIRSRIDYWLESHDLHAEVVGEFDDNALLNTFGRNGLGLFPALSVLEHEVQAECGAVPVGSLGAVKEQFYAILNERKIRHPAVEAILTTYAGGMFSPSKMAA